MFDPLTVFVVISQLEHAIQHVTRAFDLNDRVTSELCAGSLLEGW